jgi:cytochrome c-type biogenesis protein CcmH
MRRWLPWIALASVLAVGLALGAGDDEPRSRSERAEAITASVRCPTCRGQSVRNSDAPVAAAIRSEVDRRLADGQSDDEIRDYLVDRYGEAVLLKPPRSGVAGLVWVLPVAGLVAAVAVLALAFRRWRLPAVTTVAPEDLERVRRARASAPARPPEVEEAGS